MARALLLFDMPAPHTGETEKEMERNPTRVQQLVAVVTAALTCALPLGAAVAAAPQNAEQSVVVQSPEESTRGEATKASPTTVHIVQAESVEISRQVTESVGATIVSELAIIRAVSADLTEKQFQELQQDERIRRVWKDSTVSTNARLSATKATECGINGSDSFGYHGNMFLWEIDNTSRKKHKIHKVEISWPSQNGKLKAVRVDTTKIYAKHSNPDSVQIDKQWAGKMKDRELDRNDSTTLRFTFANQVVQDSDSYAIAVEFNGGCTLVFDSSNGNGNEDSDETAQRTYYPSLVGADELHQSGVDGTGITVAVVDTGAWASPQQETRFMRENARGHHRIVAHYDAIDDMMLEPETKSDRNGHGTHVTSIIASSRLRSGFYNGISPGVDIVPVRAFDETGRGTYTQVLRALDWIQTNASTYGIRVVNLSFSAEPVSFYWDDPINQAVMRLWQDGIVIVASAGNTGPDPMTIGVPGNNPYVITVGAMSDADTPLSGEDDFLASFSSAGPTFEGFVKPEIVAPGGHMLGFMDPADALPSDHPEFHDGDHYFMMSGTSQAAGVVSGISALILQQRPELTPNEVKCLLISSAAPAVAADGTLAYSIFQQGAGLVNGSRAAEGQTLDCANRGLDIALDLSGEQHYGGQASQDEDGNFYIPGLGADGYLWGHGYLWGDGYAWSDSYLWSDGYLWGDGLALSDSYLWSDHFVVEEDCVDCDSEVLSNAEDPAINVWVEQE